MEGLKDLLPSQLSLEPVTITFQLEYIFKINCSFPQNNKFGYSPGQVAVS